MSEVSIATIYEGQPSLDHLTNYLAQHGFRIAALLPHGIRGHGFKLGNGFTRAPIGVRGGGSPVQMDALFFKEPDYILQNHASPTEDLAKGLFLSFAYKYLDYSYACGEALSRLPDRDRVIGMAGKRKYLDFVQAYLKGVQEYKPVFSVRWTGVFPAGLQKEMPVHEIREDYFQHVSKQDFKDALPMLLQPEFVGLERIAAGFGFAEQAELLKYTRLSTIWGTLRYMGLCKDDANGNVQFNIDDVNSL